MPTAPARLRNGCRVTRVGGTPRGRSGRELTGSALNMQVDHGFRSAHVRMPPLRRTGAMRSGRTTVAGQ
jgi:hypothetical protein